MQGSIRQRSRLIARTKGQFMDLKEVLGDAYKDGMTFEEISNFFADKKFADLSTGNYVDKNKYESEVNSLKTQLSEKTTQLQSRMSDDEKLAAEQAEKDELIQNLQNQLKANTVSGNKNAVNGITTSVRETLGLDLADEGFVKFVDDITSEDGKKSSEIATYVTKLVKDAYEKGKKDATKDNMGAMGSGKGQGSGEPSNKDKLGEFGKTLANMSKPKEKFDYFKRN